MQRPASNAAELQESAELASSTDAGYTDLMFCDPLSCAGEAQVVRMELPSTQTASVGGEQDGESRIADVVVGYDGVVRAVRIVN